MAIKATKSAIAETAEISPDTDIDVGNLDIGSHCKIGPGVKIHCPGHFVLGECGQIGQDSTIACWSFLAGSYLYMEERVDVGRGSSLCGVHCTAELGRGVFIGKETTINTSRRVKIGDEVGIGARSGIWTHGAYLPIDMGFPIALEGVTIGCRVWLAGCTNVLPGVSIGNNAVIGMMSLVNRNVPAGCLAGGVPVKVIKERAYPSAVDLAVVTAGLCSSYQDRAVLLGLPDFGLAYTAEGILFSSAGWTGFFNFKTRCIEDSKAETLSSTAEDFRDHLRRHGIRFFTGLPFRSLQIPVSR